MIKKYNLKLSGVFLLEVQIYNDLRGSFAEVYNPNFNKKLNIDNNWIQDNQSISKKNVFRGLHFQKSNFVQSKLIRVSNGKILDIMLDLRKSSSTYKKHITIKIEKQNHILYIPRGIAHGFLSLSNNTIVNYKCDNFYNPDFESGVNPFKSKLNINWGVDINKIKLSKKDLLFPSLNNSYVFN